MLITETQSARGAASTATPSDPALAVTQDGSAAEGLTGANRRLIRVLIVDDHRAVRSALTAFLLAYDDLELAGEASDGVEALHFCERQQPDVVLMDLMMPRMDGASATRAIRTVYPQTQVLILTGSYEKRLLREALRAGAVGHWHKEVTSDELAHAIRAAYQGHPVVTP
ncbi:MAG: response regulator transcription factor [Caldilineaceae bacterium]|mgnify:CR=1 FL=1|nr:response regulator transcription factor [Caldilineaceae bacterium]